MRYALHLWTNLGDLTPWLTLIVFGVALSLLGGRIAVGSGPYQAQALFALLLFSLVYYATMLLAARTLPRRLRPAVSAVRVGERSPSAR